ncbi:MAG: UrcA family protein [Gammaproteobacteria bacterium]|nr:UrcA family protein [Gammaproteobacteria bacterium]
MLNITIFGEESMNKLFKSFALIMALAIPAIASAGVERNQIAEDKVVITFNASEATTESGRVELERQIRQAAEQVCGPQNLSRTGNMREWIQNRECYNKAVADALDAIKATS